MNTPVSTTPTAPRAVLFDLDGTLADSAPDLAAALNRMRHEQGLPAIAEHLTRPQTSSGARGLLKVGFDITPEHAQYESMKTQFLDYYEQGLAQRTGLFDGIATLLDQLDEHRIVWGIVTNKPKRFTGAVVEALGLTSHVSPIQWGIRLLVTWQSRLLELDDIRNVVGPFDQKTLTFPWRHPDPRVDALQQQMMALASVPRPRTEVPYLDEPWYC